MSHCFTLPTNLTNSCEDSAEMITVVMLYAFPEATDYERVLQLVAFQIGDTSATRRCFSVVANLDAEEEGVESFILELISGDVAAVVSSERGSATVTILDGKGNLHSFAVIYTYMRPLVEVMIWGLCKCNGGLYGDMKSCILVLILCIIKHY